MKKDFLPCFLEKYPVAHALARSLEASVLSQFKLVAPSLDFGCGDGLFAQICFGKEKIDVGVDISSQKVKLAQKSGAYRQVFLLENKKLPFKDSSFQTVVSNSVFEHIQGIDPVLAEINRVLKKRGRLIFTVPGKKTIQFWTLTKFLGSWYVNFKNCLWRHKILEDRNYWVSKLEGHGFRVEQVLTFADQKAIVLLDYFYPLATFSFLTQKIFGRYFIFRPKFLNNFLAGFLSRRVEFGRVEDGASLCFETEKL